MNIIFAPAYQLAQMIRQREISATEVLNAYLEQIARYNHKINAIAATSSKVAIKRAKEADQALAKGEIWGVLHGVPITIKDTLETAGLLTTSGYEPLKDYVPKQDATTVARLRAAGAIIFAKTNLSRLAGDYQTNNPIFGQTNAQMDRFLERWDAWICPVSITPAFPHCSFGEPIKVDGVKFPYILACGGYTMPLNLTGNPVVVIPVGQSKEGLPIGVQVVGKRWKDLELLAIATEINKAIGDFQRPDGY